MEYTGFALADYYDAFNLYMCAMRLRCMPGTQKTGGPDFKDSKMDKINEMIMLSLIGMSTCFYSLGEPRWGFETMDLLVFICQNQMKPGTEISNYIRDMLIFYDSKHNQHVFQMNEFERILLGGFPGNNSAELFRDKIYDEELKRNNEKRISNKVDYKFATSSRSSIHEIIQRYRPAKGQLDKKIREWYASRIKAQKELFFESLRSKDSKLSTSIDEEYGYLLSKSTNMSGINIPSSPTKSPTRLTKKSFAVVLSPSRSKSIYKDANDTSVDRDMQCVAKLAFSRFKGKRSTVFKSKIMGIKPRSHSLDDLNCILGGYSKQLQDSGLQPRKNKKQIIPKTIMASMFENDGQYGITQYFRRKILKDLNKDFKGSRGLDDAGKRQEKSVKADAKLEDKLTKAKLIIESSKANHKLNNMQQEYALKESDPLAFDPQSLQNAIKETRFIKHISDYCMDSLAIKNGTDGYSSDDTYGPSNTRNLLGFENLEKQDLSKIEQFMRKHPKIFAIGKMTAFKDSISKTHPFYLEEQAKLEALVNKERDKSELMRKVKAEGVDLH